jgi:hypothetical protein
METPLETLRQAVSKGNSSNRWKLENEAIVIRPVDSTSDS